MDVEISPEALEELEQLQKTDPEAADKIRDLIAKTRQVAEGIETGQYESFEQGMEALTGVKPEPVEALLYDALYNRKTDKPDDSGKDSEENEEGLRKEFLELKSKAVLEKIYGPIRRAFRSDNQSSVALIFFSSVYSLFTEITLAFAASKNIDEFCDFMAKIEKELNATKELIEEIVDTAEKGKQEAKEQQSS